jgi:hypothetical protein
VRRRGALPAAPGRRVPFLLCSPALGRWDTDSGKRSRVQYTAPRLDTFRTDTTPATHRLQLYLSTPGILAPIPQCRRTTWRARWLSVATTDLSLMTMSSACAPARSLPSPNPFLPVRHLNRSYFLLPTHRSLPTYRNRADPSTTARFCLSWRIVLLCEPGFVPKMPGARCTRCTHHLATPGAHKPSHSTLIFYPRPFSSIYPSCAARL